MQTKQDIKQTIKTLKAFQKHSSCPSNKKEWAKAQASSKNFYIISKDEVIALKLTIDLLSDCI